MTDPPPGVPRMPRFFNRAIARAADLLGARYEEHFGGWLTETTNGVGTLWTYGYQISLNSVVSASIARDKASSAEVLARHGVPTVPTLLVLNDVRQSWIDGRTAQEVLAESLDALELPVIVKPNEGTSGEDIFFCSSRRRAEHVALELVARHPSLALQEYADITTEQRWIFLDGECLLQYEKTPAVGPAHPIFNLTRGATVANFTSQPKDAENEALARSAADAIGLRVCAVDLIRTDARGWQVLEVNSGIALEYFSRNSDRHTQAAEQVYLRIVAAALDGDRPS